MMRCESLLCIVKVHTDAINLLLPFTNNAIKLFGLLLHGRVKNLGLIKLFSHCNSFLFIALSHHIGFANSFAELSSNVFLSTHLLIKMILHSCNIMFSISKLSKKGLALLSFIVSNSTGF